MTAHEPAELVLVGDHDRVDRVANAFAGLIDAKSPSTAGHSHRVAALVVAAAEELGEPATPEIERAALLHDIGKLSLSSRLLDKPGRLTAPEWEAVRAHPLHTERLLCRVAPLRRVAAIAAAHHERLDGSGYPHGLRATSCRSPRGCWPSPTSTRRSRRSGLTGRRCGPMRPRRCCATRRAPAAWTATASRRSWPRAARGRRPSRAARSRSGR